MYLIVQLISCVGHSNSYSFIAEEWSGISNEAKNLIRKLLTYDPKQRINAKEALNDIWITTYAEKTNEVTNLSSKYLNNLSKFHVIPKKFSLGLILVHRLKINLNKQF